MKRFETFRLDTSNECLWQNGVQINLPPKPFAVLRYLVENPGRLISHDELLDALWPETYVQPQVLRTYMLDLRKILGDDPACPRFIQTLPKRGYCFVALVTDAGMPDSALRTTSEAQPAIFDGVVGREPELIRLKTLAQALACGQRQTVFITGATGIGKTALVEAACHQMVAMLSASVASAHCVERAQQEGRLLRRNGSSSSARQRSPGAFRYVDRAPLVVDSGSSPIADSHAGAIWQKDKRSSSSLRTCSGQMIPRWS